jgi:hypothetical protein
MDINRLFVGIVMLLPVGLVMWLIAHAEAWRAAVMALHLNWEREQRQAGTAGVLLQQRQDEQRQFEVLVTSRPMSMLWVHVALTFAAIAFCLVFAWRMDGFRWIGLWLVLPFGLAAAAGIGYAWMRMRNGVQRMAVISSTLYGPPPPRVKVRTLQVQEPEA